MSDLIVRPELPKRFYKDVGVFEDEGAFSVRLDGRPVRTPLRSVLQAPVRDIADLIAEEWAAQIDVIDPATMPLTRLVNTVLDGVAKDPGAVAADLARYAETDLLVYRAAEPQRLVDRQRDGWDPVIAWAEKRIGSPLHRAEGVMFVAQPAESVVGLTGLVSEERDPFRLSALHQITTLTGSLLLALAVADGFLSTERAWALAHVDEDWNIELWGEDEEARRRRDHRFLDMKVAASVLNFVPGPNQIPAYQS